MNTKKNKNKKRTKAAKGAESGNKCELSYVNEENIATEQLCEQLSEIDQENIVVGTAESTISETIIEDHVGTPVKPKRKKKKKQDDKKISDDINKCGLNNVLILNQNEEVSKDNDNANVNIKTTPEVTIDVKEMITSITNDFVPETQISKSKKKHKKNKHRLDSEQSEKSSDDVRCTSAFEKLIKAEVAQEIISDINLQDEQNITSDAICEMQSDDKETLHDEPKRKKKAKKNKPASEASGSNIEQKNLSEELETKQGIITIEQPLELTEAKTESPKPRAKIAKPVSKKRKDKNKSLIENVVDEKSNIESGISEKFDLPGKTGNDIPDFEKDIKTVIGSEIDESQILVNVDKKNTKHIKDGALEEIILDEHREVVESIDLIRNEHEDVQSDNAMFTDVRPSRKKKKAKKGELCGKSNEAIQITPEKKIEGKNDESNLVIPSIEPQSRPETVEIEDTNNTPDLIQYPRSSSQQQIDRNNNMVIHEISAPEDVFKLDIPSAMPFIQGSGETPDVNIKICPIGTQVTEIKEISMDSKEQTKPSSDNDFEKDMNDLKLSIEKSFAELSSMDSNFDKQYVPTQDTINTEKKDVTNSSDNKKEEKTEKAKEACSTLPICPTRRDKGKGKSKKKGNKGVEQSASVSQTQTTNIPSNTQEPAKSDTKEKSDSTESDKKQKSETKTKTASLAFEVYFEPIEKFEDALTSSTDDINKTFEMIANEASGTEKTNAKTFQNPEISITAPEEEKTKKPVSQPKNFIGCPNIPVSSNKSDFKKEKHKPPSTIVAKVKIKDSVDVEKTKESNELQTLKRQKMSVEKPSECFTYKTNGGNEFIYKYSFRKVFLANVCHVCRKELSLRVPCKFCNLIFYCSQKHKDEDWNQHQSLCFAVCTISHLKEKKFIYESFKNKTGQEYRIMRMQMILSCEKMLKRKLVPWEQEVLLYPRICADESCREWRQGRLADCEGCGQIAFCATQPEHLPASHKRWCNSYTLYHKLVNHQQTKGRLEPKLPSKVMTDTYQIPEKINGVLASLYEERLDMDDIHYAALTQIATDPLTIAYAYQVYSEQSLNNGITKSTFTIHIIGAELQHEADAVNRWEIFFLHLRPDIMELRVVLINNEINPSKLPLDLLNKVKLCNGCTSNNRNIVFKLEDGKTYEEYYNSNSFVLPDIVCCFNPSIDRCSVYSDDSWPSTIQCLTKLKSPLLLTSNTLGEIKRDMIRIKKYVNIKVLIDGKLNSFASARPDRNFISDNEMPLLFKNYVLSVLCGF